MLWAVWFSVVALGAVWLMPQVRRLWRHQSSIFDRPHAYWVGGEVTWRAYRRVVPVIFAMALPILITVVVLFVHEDDHESTGFRTASTVLIGLTVLYCALVSQIALFNRPRLLVPPHLRRENGLIRDLLGR